MKPNTILVCYRIFRNNVIDQLHAKTPDINQIAQRNDVNSKGRTTKAQLRPVWLKS
jgi:hypothetical protein